MADRPAVTVSRERSPGRRAPPARRGLPLLVTETNPANRAALLDLRADFLAKTGGNAVINVDPNDSPDARAIVEAAKEGARLV